MITARRFHVITEIGEEKLVVTTAQIEESTGGETEVRSRETRVIGAFDRELRVMELRIDRIRESLTGERDESVRLLELEGIRPGSLFDARIREIAATANCPALLPMLSQVGATALRCYRTGAFERRKNRSSVPARPV